MTTRVEVEEIETTRSEKLLATVLTIFLLIGLLWVYFHIDVERDYVSPSMESVLTAAERDAIDRRELAGEDLDRARESERMRRETLVDRRESYRTALDEGRRDATAGTPVPRRPGRVRVSSASPPQRPTSARSRAAGSARSRAAPRHRHPAQRRTRRRAAPP
ncbi:MAG TPA: hypothetical protein VGV67_12535 [Solirubrobacteraceae bacterium]|nr:hypothetical protein [Solirubrobacteraceae bacterium]